MATEEELYQQYLQETGQATDYSQDKQPSKLPSETSMNVAPQGEEALYQQYLQETGQEPIGDINAPVDAEINIYKPQQTMSMQEYGLKLKEEGVPYEDRVSKMREYRRTQVDESGIYYLDETKDNPLNAIGSAMLATGVGLNRIVEDTLGLDMNVEQGTKMVQGAQKGMDTGTKLTGDIVAGTILGGTRLGPAAAQIGMQTLGEGGTYMDAVINSALTYGGGKVLEAGGQALADAASPYTRGTLAAARMLSQNEGLTGLKTQDILDSVAHLPKEHQTMALVMGTDDLKMLNQVKAVIEDNSLLSSKFGDELLTRTSVLKSLGQNSEDLKIASQKWSQMTEAVAEVPDDFPLAGINKSIDYISNLYATEGGKAATIINRLKLAAEEGQTIKLADIVELRKDVNFLASKSTPGTKEYGHFKTVKDTLNSLVDVSTVNRPQLKQLIDETVSNYSRVKNNVDYTAVLTKNTSPSGVVNYGNLMSDIREARLSSPEVDKAVEISKMFDTKFSLDKGLTGLKPSASRTEKQLYWGSMFRWAVDTLTPYNRLFDKARFSDKLIQADIRQSIRDSKSITEFMTKVKDSTNIPKPAKDRLDELLLRSQMEHQAIESSTIAKQMDFEVTPPRPAPEPELPMVNNSNLTPPEWFKPEAVSTSRMTYDDMVDSLQSSGYTLFSRNVPDGTRPNFVDIDNRLYRLTSIDGRGSGLTPVNSVMENIIRQRPETLLPPVPHQQTQGLRREAGERATRQASGIEKTIQSNLESRVLNRSSRRGEVTGVAVAETNGGRGLSIEFTTPNGTFGTSTNSSSYMFKDKVVYKISTPSLPANSGLGYDVYKESWDYVKAKGGVYEPSDSLIGTNPFRLPLNMLRYASEKGWSNVDHLLVKNTMVGVESRRPVEFTQNVAKKLTRNLVTKLRESLGVDSLKNLTPQELEAAFSRRFGEGQVTRQGYTLKSYQDLIRFMKDLSPRTAFGLAPFLVLFDEKDEL